MLLFVLKQRHIGYVKHLMREKYISQDFSINLIDYGGYRNRLKDELRKHFEIKKLEEHDRFTIFITV